MEAKTKHIIIGTSIGSGVGLICSFFIKDKVSWSITILVGAILGAVSGVVYTPKSSIVGSGDVTSETKKNKIVFTR